MPRMLRSPRSFATLAILGALGLSAAGCAKKLDAPQAVLLTDTTSASVGGKVKLDASGSTDPNGLALAFSWRLTAVPAGSRAQVGSADKMRAWVDLDVPGDYEVELVVSDGVLSSEPVRAVVTATSCGAGLPTVATVVAAPVTATLGAPVQLTATAGDADLESTCSAGDELTWHWQLAAEPAGSTARLNDGALDNPSFTPDVAGDYVVAVTVSDRAGHVSAPASSTVHVGACGSAAPTAAQPTAQPAAPATGQTVTLSSALADADSAAPCSKVEDLLPHWSLASVPAGSLAALNGATFAAPSFVADVPGDYVVEVYATDAEGHAGAHQSLKVTASACGTNPPVASISGVATGVGGVVDLAAVVTDGDASCGISETFAYAWSFRSLPAGSHAKLNDATLVAPSFVPDAAGTYTVALVVTDSLGDASAVATTDVVVDATPACGASTPVARVGLAQPALCLNNTNFGGTGTFNACTVTLGGSSPTYTVAAKPSSCTGNCNQNAEYLDMQLDASASTDADNASPCSAGQALTYSWDIVAEPAGGQATFGVTGGNNTTTIATHSTLVNPTLSFVRTNQGNNLSTPVAGAYKLSLTTSDGTHTSAPVVVQINVTLP